MVDKKKKKPAEVESEDMLLRKLGRRIIVLMFGRVDENGQFTTIEEAARRNQVTMHNTPDRRDWVISRLVQLPIDPESPPDAPSPVKVPGMVFVFNGLPEAPQLAQKRAIRFAGYCREQLRHFKREDHLAWSVWGDEEQARVTRALQYPVKLLPPIPPADDSNPAHPKPNRYPVWVPYDAVHVLARIMAPDRGKGLRQAMFTGEFEHIEPLSYGPFRTAK